MRMTTLRALVAPVPLPIVAYLQQSRASYFVGGSGAMEAVAATTARKSAKSFSIST